MTKTRRSASLVSLIALVLAALTPAAFATPDDHGDTGKVTICHATSSATNPYVVITIDPAAILQEGHDGHEGPVFDPATHHSGGGWGDIIPPFDYSYEKGGETVEGTYAGMNWTAEGRAIWENDCMAPTPEEPEEGALSITKQVTGDLAPDGASYRFTVDCGGEWVWTDQALAAGATWGPQTLPAGTACTITETDDQDAEQVTWRVGDGDETTGSSANVTIAADTTVAVTFTNHFGDEEPPPGEPEVQLLLAKEWTGDEIDADDVTVSFTIDGTAYAPGNTLTVDPGTTVTITSESVEGFPEGCSFEPTTLEHTTAAFEDWSDAEKDALLRTETFTVTNVVDCVAVDDGEAGIALEKEALVPLDDDGMRTVTLGDDGTVDVIYRYTITNTGDVDLTIAELDDDRIGDLLGELSTTTLPADGDPLVVEVTVTLTADDFDGEGDTHTNVAYVKAEEGPDDEADETIGLVEVRDVVVTPPAPERPVTPGERPVTPGERPEVLGVVAQQPAQLPVTGPDSVLGMLIAAMAALGLGAGLLKLQPATQARRRGREEG